MIILGRCHLLILLLLLHLLLPLILGISTALGFYSSPQCKLWTHQHLVVTVPLFVTQREASLRQEMQGNSSFEGCWHVTTYLKGSAL